jgi:hypothetical protein
MFASWAFYNDSLQVAGTCLLGSLCDCACVVQLIAVFMAQALLLWRILIVLPYSDTWLLLVILQIP